MAELRKRLLILFALGTNIGIKRIVTSGPHGVTEAQLRGTRRNYISRDGLRRAIAAVVNETMRGRDPRWWGTGTTCASDSKKFESWESSLMTEWRARYGGPGVMIYWHVERKSVCVYSQLKKCSSSEVAAMMEGLIRHSADVDSNITANYTDMSGQANHEADPEAPVQDSRLGNVRPQLRQVLANPGQLRVSERVWSALRSRSSGHDRTS